jgi:pyrroloquinoline-quinone synthase
MTSAATAMAKVKPTQWYEIEVEDDRLLSADELAQALEQIGHERYHSLHPFHKMLHGGELDHGQVQAWALNRYYYQASIPRKDLTLMARLPSAELRRAWRSRVLDHDGVDLETGGIARYLQLTDRLGLDRDYVISTEGILPATRFAVDAYVDFVRTRSQLEAIASSLTELFAPAIHRERIAGLSKHYEWADDHALAYFKKRLGEAPKDAEFGRDYVIREAKTRASQEAVLNAIRFKTDMLWAQLDALYFAYVDPGMTPPGAFVPEG